VREAILHFTRRFAMDIDHVGDKLVEVLVGEKLVTDVADLYDLTIDSVQALPRMAQKSAQNVVQSIAASKERTFDRLLCALGIPQIGQVAAKQLAEVIPSLDGALSLDPSEIAARAIAIDGFGESMVQSVTEFFQDPAQRALLEKLRARGVSRPYVVTPTQTPSGPLAGKAFCVTGVLSKKREDVHADIERAGGVVHDSVKASTNFLVAGEKVGESKLQAARKKGVTVISENELNAMIEPK
jgi:DNA ligase (NAD+)